jgi:hypothetical protein
MRQACKTVYQFDELDDRAKERARDWWRQADIHSDWYESVLDDAKQCLAFAGFDIDKIYFSGFSSQGDGACFIGSWSADKVDPHGMLEHAPQDKELRDIADSMAAIAAAHPDASISCKHRGLYSHEYCAEFSDMYFPDDPIESMDYGSSEYMAREKVLHEAEEAAIETARDAMRWIYRQLEREYDYQNSAECVDEAIRANEYEFVEDGRRYAYR